MRLVFSLFLPLLFLSCARMPTPVDMPPAAALRVLTFNILKGGTELGQPLAQTAKVIEASGANVVILQEQDGAAKGLARLLRWHYHVVSKSVAVMSPYPLTAHYANGAAVEYAPGKRAHVFGCHLEAYPYGPYDLRDDTTLTADALVATAVETRAHQIGPILEAMAPHVDSGEPVFLGGDFNEPSHLDWTAATAAAGMHFGRAVAWPTSRAVCSAGLTDAYRAVHADPVVKPGETWTPLRDTADEVHDRIDQIYYAGEGIGLVEALVVGEATAHADVVVTPYPSDHRAVLAVFSLSGR